MQGPLHCYGHLSKCSVVPVFAWLCHKAEVRVGAAGAQYKFIVDGDWKYAPDQPAMYDEGQQCEQRAGGAGVRA